MNGLITGLSAEISMTVTESDTAARWGSGFVPVFGTPTLIARKIAARPIGSMATNRGINACKNFEASSGIGPACCAEDLNARRRQRGVTESPCRIG